MKRKQHKQSRTKFLFRWLSNRFKPYQTWKKKHYIAIFRWPEIEVKLKILSAKLILNIPLFLFINLINYL